MRQKSIAGCYQNNLGWLYLEEGHHWVVDIDLEKFFDRVNHDVLMSRVAKWITDKRVLKLIRAFLNAGIMQAGRAGQSTDGRHTAGWSVVAPVVECVAG
ncbi:reverse transcriptase domain-containing protein [Symbiopectobacterium sp. RP]|uniref:reverse transcriptase domain-containing protein n=1 Tax=Symbiopectobacterium sp. RP TaxID=3248553 RepID=UPI003D28519E